MNEYIIMFFVVSFIGYVVEVLEGIVNRNDYVNRGFLIGPICPIYGIGSILLSLLLNKQDNILILFVIGSLICTILEYFSSVLLEKIFKARWWDYSNHKYNIQGRVALQTMVLFGISSIILMKIINPVYFSIINLFSNKVKILLLTSLLTLMILDLLYSVRIIISVKKNGLITDVDCTREMKKYMRLLR